MRLDTLRKEPNIPRMAPNPKIAATTIMAYTMPTPAEVGGPNADWPVLPTARGNSYVILLYASRLVVIIIDVETSKSPSRTCLLGFSFTMCLMLSTLYHYSFSFVGDSSQSSPSAEC